jgi:hypothetical protein
MGFVWKVEIMMAKSIALVRKTGAETQTHPLARSEIEDTETKELA